MKKISLLLIFATIYFWSTSAFSQNMVLDQAKISAIETLVEKKLLKFDFSLDKAWISPSVWNQYNIDGKQSFSVLCAMYIKHRKGNKTDSHPVIDVYDYNNGKHLASFGPLRGFKIIN